MTAGFAGLELASLFGFIAAPLIVIYEIRTTKLIAATRLYF
jgi:hypothetical protein